MLGVEITAASPFDWASQVALVVKNPAAKAGDLRDTGSIPGSGRAPGGGVAAHSSTLAWTIPWTEEPGRLPSIGSQSQTQLKQLSLLQVTAECVCVCVRDGHRDTSGYHGEEVKAALWGPAGCGL